jgi:hypothetical protein
MEQLTKLRHRGAFSTVAQTFTLCCQRMATIEGQGLTRTQDHQVRVRWYNVSYFPLARLFSTDYLPRPPKLKSMSKQTGLLGGLLVCPL